MSEVNIRTRGNFTVLPNKILKEKISNKALGIYFFMMSLGTGWNYSIKGLMKARMIGIRALRGALKELANAGYVIITKIPPTKGNNQFTYTYDVFFDKQVKKVNQDTGEVTESLDTHNVPLQNVTVQNVAIQNVPLYKETNNQETNNKIQNNSLDVKDLKEKKEHKDNKDKDRSFENDLIRNNNLLTRYLINFGYLNKTKDKYEYCRYNHLFDKHEKELNWPFEELKNIVQYFLYHWKSCGTKVTNKWGYFFKTFDREITSRFKKTDRTWINMIKEKDSFKEELIKDLGGLDKINPYFFLDLLLGIDKLYSEIEYLARQNNTHSNKFLENKQELIERCKEYAK